MWLLGPQKIKTFSDSGGLRPPDQGLCPWTPLGALPPDPRYRLALSRSPCPGLKPPKRDTLASPLITTSVVDMVCKGWMRSTTRRRGRQLVHWCTLLLVVESDARLQLSNTDQSAKLNGRRLRVVQCSVIVGHFTCASHTVAYLHCLQNVRNLCVYEWGCTAVLVT